MLKVMKWDKTEVLRTVMELSLNWECEGVVNISWLASQLDSTNYYLRKEIKTLINEGYLVHAIRSGGICEFSDEPYPPLKGYALTEKAKDTEMYSLVVEEDERLLREIFDCLDETL